MLKSGGQQTLASYIRKRFPNAKESELEGMRAAFLIEAVEVYWKPLSELERVRVHVGYGSSTIKILLPEFPEYSSTDKKRIEDEYHERYACRIKESHARMNALLWFLLSEEKKDEIRGYFPQDISVDELDLFNQNKKD